MSYHSLTNFNPGKKSTTIRITRATKEKLAEYARYGESMDKIINSLFIAIQSQRDFSQYLLNKFEEYKKQSEKESNTYNSVDESKDAWEV